MLPLGHRVAFAVFAAITLLLGARGFYRMYRRVTRGRNDAEPRFDGVAGRLWYALWTTLLQTRVFRKRRTLSVFHSFIFYAFVLYLLVNAVDAVDGFTELQPLGSVALRAIYGSLTDAFSVLAIVGVVVFVLRRYFLGARRDFRFNDLTLLHEKVKAGYIQRDSAIVSAFILLHVSSRIVGNAARLSMVGADRWQPFGTALSTLFRGPHAMEWRIAGYWGALGSVLLFLVYFPYSKHIHLLMAPVKYIFHRRAGSGQLPSPKIDLEAAEPDMGAGKLADLAWPRLLDAYACIQCNRCQDVCPASQTGKALSPAALEINKRMVLNGIAGEVSAFSLAGTAAFERGGSATQSAGPSLLQAVISPEAVWACTTCGACMQVCPTQDEQMLDIIDIRRNMVMAEGEFPSQLGSAFRGMERTSNPWGMAREKRMDWAEGLVVPTIAEVPDPDVLYWVGCAASYDASAGKTARATVQLLAEAKLNFAVLGKQECCTGDTARRAGNELLYQEMAIKAVTVLNAAKPKTVLASCPHCVNTISTEYPQFGGNFHVVHHTEYLAGLVDAGRLSPVRDAGTVTFHDPCYLGRHRGTYDPPRSVLHVLANDYIELGRTRDNAFCCGAGGAQFWKEEERGTERISENRFSEVQTALENSQGAKTLAVGCPFCKSMLASTPAAAESSIAIKDVAELLWESVQRSKLPPKERQHPAREAQPTQTVIAPVEVPVPPPSAPSSIPEPTSEESTTGQPGTPSHRAPEVQIDAPAIHLSSATLPTAETTATPQPERKKWTPRAAAAVPLPGAESNAAATTVDKKPAPESSEGEVASKAPEARKKWTPRAVAAVPLPGAESNAATTADTKHAPESSVDEVASKAPAARKKWQPKSGK